jgi:hypothetical protein
MWMGFFWLYMVSCYYLNEIAIPRNPLHWLTFLHLLLINVHFIESRCVNIGAPL